MHDVGLRRSKHRESAVGEVEAWIEVKVAGARILTSEELARYAARSPVCGWRIPITLRIGRRFLDLIILPEFPRMAPRVALVEVGMDPNATPHVEEDGVLCLLDDMSSVADDDPLRVTQHVLESAQSLLERFSGGDVDAEFRREYLTYWARDSSKGAAPVFSLLRAAEGTRGIVAWAGRNIVLVAENEEDADHWLRHRFRDLDEKLVFVAGALFWMNQELVPSEFPRSRQQVLALSDGDRVGRRSLMEAAKACPSELFIVLGCNSGDAVCFTSVSLRRPPHLGHGFRPGERWRKFFAFGSAPARRHVLRIDGPWIHGRGKDERHSRLAKTSVIIIGCGSVGAPTAIALANAGVGSLTLIDPQVLESANVGRHPLGVADVGSYKSKALRNRLLSKLPHMTDVVEHHEGWQEIFSKNPRLFESADLVLSATGVWAEEGALNEWHVGSGRKIPVLYGWTEAHAVAGHAVVIKGSGGCLRCGTNSVGVRRFRVSDWPDGLERLKAEPGCGGLFQPYGPVELMSTIGLVAEMALDALLDDGQSKSSFHRVWSAREARIREFGGSWTSDWRKTVGDNERGSQTRELEWEARSTCRECQ
ncbi:MAG: hypothetical protein DRI90_00725 [Deltaproteobacteria bacterium]|nr:MAG: hypothetical protein DRI90_00725 [Deltaproteobacteria bacterium]